MSLCTVQRWVERAGQARLDRVDWSSRPPRNRTARRTAALVEAAVLTTRRALAASPLGEVGADAIYRTLQGSGLGPIPSVRTTGRILQRQGVLDGRRRIRRPPPPRGWYLSPVVAGHADIGSVDIVEGLAIQAGPVVEVLNLVAVQAGLVASWPAADVTAKFVVAALTAIGGSGACPRMPNSTTTRGSKVPPNIATVSVGSRGCA